MGLYSDEIGALSSRVDYSLTSVHQAHEDEINSIDRIFRDSKLLLEEKIELAAELERVRAQVGRIACYWLPFYLFFLLRLFSSPFPRKYWCFPPPPLFFLLYLLVLLVGPLQLQETESALEEEKGNVVMLREKLSKADQEVFFL